MLPAGKDHNWDNLYGFPGISIPHGSAPEMIKDNSQITAMHAANCALHADYLATHTVELAGWVKYLENKCSLLQSKVNELETWKEQTSKHLKILRNEHNALKRHVKEEEEKQLPSTWDTLDAQHMTRAKLSPVSVPVPEITTPTTTGKIPESHPHLPPPQSPSPPLVLEEPGDSQYTPPQSALGLTEPKAPPGLPPPQQGPVMNSYEADAAMGPQPNTTLQDEVLQPPSLGRSTSQDELKEEGAVEGIKMTTAFDEISQRPMMKAEWRIGHLTTKLRGTMGRALVSPTFQAYGIPAIRLLVCPDAKEASKGPRSKKQKENYAKKVSDGPLEGCLKLKVPSCPKPYVIEYYLKVGSVRFGPYSDNFSECIVSPPRELEVDWLKEVDTSDNSLTVEVDILQFTPTTDE